MVCFSSSARVNAPMTLEEAKAIQAQTHLFGYVPDIQERDGKHYIWVSQDADEETVNDLLKEMRSNTSS